MPIFKLFALKTMRLLNGFARNASNFTCSHLDLKNFPGEITGRETPENLLTEVGKGMEGIKSTYL